MDVIIIFNGLGNQMSQYAFYLRKKTINPSTRFLYLKNSKNQHDGISLKHAFNIDLQYNFLDYILLFIYNILVTTRLTQVSKPITKILMILGVKIIKEAINYDYDESNLLSKKGIHFYWGGWHSEKYFFPIRDKILNTFNFQLTNIENDPCIFKYVNEIKEKNSVSIHVRRGDFLTSGGFYQFADVCTLDYYKKAIQTIMSKVENPYFFVFSDDLDWCRKNLFFKSVTFADCNKGSNSWKDMYLMSLCKHNINANSTFSWWGSWLNLYKNKNIIVPKYFINQVETKDFYPENWIKIN